MTSLYINLNLFLIFNLCKPFDYYRMEYSEETLQFLESSSNQATIEQMISKYQFADSISIAVAYNFYGEYHESISGNLAYELKLKLTEQLPYTKVLLSTQDPSIYPGVFLSNKKKQIGFREVRIIAYYEKRP